MKNNIYTMEELTNYSYTDNSLYPVVYFDIYPDTESTQMKSTFLQIALAAQFTTTAFRIMHEGVLNKWTDE